MATYRITYENKTESQKIESIKIFQYCTIEAPTISAALNTFEKSFCWEAIKIQKIK